MKKGENKNIDYQDRLKIVLKAKNEKEIPNDVASKFEKILHDEMDVESWRKLVKWLGNSSMPENWYCQVKPGYFSSFEPVKSNLTKMLCYNSGCNL